MKNLIQVEGNSSLARDTYSTAVINTNYNEYNEYMSHREKKLQERQEIENLKSDVSEIKDMIKLILQKL